MGGRKLRSAIDAVAYLIQKTQEAWNQRQLIGALFLDVKGAFDHVHPEKLVARMAELGLDRDLIRWVLSFLTDRKVQLVIDGILCMQYSMHAVPYKLRGSPMITSIVYPFTIYLSGVFEAIEKAVLGI